jgi:hypothetical protein
MSAIVDSFRYLIEGKGRSGKGEEGKLEIVTVREIVLILYSWYKYMHLDYDLDLSGHHPRAWQQRTKAEGVFTRMRKRGVGPRD